MAVALITGATSGIGKATAELFAKQGIDLILSGRNVNRLEKLQEDLSKQVNVQILPVDLTVEEERQQLIVLLKNQAPDIVINNAGFGKYGPVLNFSTQEQLEILEVNGKVVLEITIEAARALVSENRKGVILNVSSAAAFQVFPNMAIYAASKGFVNQFSQALDFEFQQEGVRVLTLCPGVVATDFQSRAGGNGNHTQAMKMMTPSFVAEQIWKQIQTLCPLRIIDWRYRILTCISNLLPKRWIAKILKQNIDNRLLKDSK